MRLIAIAALASAAMLWLASPAAGIGWLAWVALVPVAVVVLAAPGTRATRLAVPLAYAVHLELLMVPAFPFGLAEGQWGDPALPVLIGDSPVIAIALVGIPLVGALLYLIRFGEPWGASQLPLRGAAVAAVAIPALAWTALDFARASADPAALWGPLFLSQADQPAGALATLAGPWLVTLAIVAVNYGIAAALVNRRGWLALVPIVAVIALVLAGRAVEREHGGAPSLTVAAVQPGYDTAEGGRPELRFFRRGTFHLAALDLVDDLGELTREASAAGARLVVWPEASLYVDPRSEPDVRRSIARLVEETGAAIVIPFFRPRPIGAGEVLAATPAPGGARFTATRPKHRPLWFIGEDRAEGEPGPIALDGQRIGTLLGTDTQDARHAAALVADGAVLLASATHDWRQSSEPARAYAQLAARAAGAPLVRADWRHGSAIYAASGRVAAAAGTQRERLTLVADVGLAAGRAPYARIGDALGWAAVVAAVAALAAGWASRAGGRGGGGRAPRRGSPRRRPFRGRPRAAAGQTPPPR